MRRTMQNSEFIMKSTILNLTLAFFVSSAASFSAVAQEEPVAEPAQTPPPVESPAPEPAATVVESAPPVADSNPQPVTETQPAPSVETPASEAPVSEEAARSRRPAESPAAEDSSQRSRPDRTDSGPAPDGRGVRETLAPNQTTSDADRVAQSGRPGRGSDRQPGGPPRGDDRRGGDRRDDGRGHDRGDDGRRGDDRRDDGRRPQFGISIGPGGVQVFRGNPGIGPGYSRPSRGNYYDWDRRRGYAPPWYQGRGWGIGIDTRPQYVAPSGPVIVTQPQSVQPVAPQQPEEPPVPTDEQLSGMPGVELRGLVLYSVDRLDEQLDGLSTGRGWKSFLKTEDLKRIVPPPTLAPLPPESDDAAPTVAEPILPESTRRQLAEILKSYERVQQNGEYRQISQLWGFQTTHVALRELLIPPVHRLRKQLSLSIELLNEELQQFETHEQWSRHLKLELVKKMSTVPPEDVSAADRKQLQTVISTFDTVAAEPSYRMISDLLGFRLTQSGARAYLAQLQVSAPPAPPAQP